MIKWHLAIESKHISIEQKLPGSYHKLQFIMDYLDASLTVEVKSFKAKISIIQNKYLRGNPDKWTTSYIRGEIIEMCNNMSADGPWQHKIGEKDQIIALTTKVAKLQMKLEKKVIAFDTQAKSVINPSSEINANSGRCCGKKTGRTLSQNGTSPRRKAQLLPMAKHIIGAIEIIIAVAQSTMECMPITNPVIMMHGKHALMQIAMLRPMKRHLTELPKLQMLPPKNLLSMISCETPFAHMLVFLLKQLTGFGKIPREMSRSKSRVE
jgi:hypothetical protein